MDVKGITPILNVSDFEASVAWFEQLGWTRVWGWGDPPTFGAIQSGTSEIFLCVGAQGSRGEREARHPGDEETGGVWMTWWVESPADVDVMHARALAVGMIVTWPPTDEPWDVREFHLRHPDGHTFRVSSGLGEDE
jgi:catechol 2,3-dioxygenase-like lactoylglutathione lyase family enzyme